jgi:hypothetical protein
VLAPEIFNEKELLVHQKAKPKSFASEFLLEPFYSSETYFSGDDINKIVDPKLRNLPALIRHKFDENTEIFGGFDVGKKRHPSHLALFRRNRGKIEQIHSSYLEGWNYTDQVEYLNDVAENFNVTRGYIDNTRGELEDRGLVNVWFPLSFTQKSKATMAGIMEELILGGRTAMLNEPRQIAQMTQVNNNLQATTTVAGHGDAFFSVGMALQAAYETDLYGMKVIGNLQGWVDGIESNKSGKDPVRTWLERLESPKDDEYNKGMTDAQYPLEGAPNPNCNNQGCTPKAWIKENNLCLMCLHRGDKPLLL